MIITGSIDNIFLSQSYAGANRALKYVDRARPVVELAELITASFADIRARIAAARNPAVTPTR